MDRYWNGRALSGEEEASRGGLGSPHRGTHHITTWPTISNIKRKREKKILGNMYHGFDGHGQVLDATYLG